MAKRGLYSISIVAELLDIHPQTIRLYERKGLIKPARTQGNTRLFSPQDVEEIRMILRLTNDLGVNLAGVEVILNMRQKMVKMEEEMIQLLNIVKERFMRFNQQQETCEALVPLNEAKRQLSRLFHFDLLSTADDTET